MATIQLNPSFATTIKRVFVPSTFNLKDGNPVVIPYFDPLGNEYTDEELKTLVESKIRFMIETGPVKFINGKSEFCFSPFVQYIDVGILVDGTIPFWSIANHDPVRLALFQKEVSKRKQESEHIYVYPKRHITASNKFGL